MSVLVGWVPTDKNRRDAEGRTPLELARPGSPIAAVLAQFAPRSRHELRSDHAVLADVGYYLPTSPEPWRPERETRPSGASLWWG